jgi:hypothetical protein
VSPAIADRAGSNKKTYTGMKIEEEPVPVDPNQPILHRHDDKERQEERAVVPGTGRRQAHEFAKAQERRDRKKPQGDDAAKH